MCSKCLVPFWIGLPDPYWPIGFGVTAFSLADAMAIIHGFGYELPKEWGEPAIVANVRMEDLDPHVARNLGPIVVRGIWYPFCSLGLPGWHSALTPTSRGDEATSAGEG